MSHEDCPYELDHHIHSKGCFLENGGKMLMKFLKWAAADSLFSLWYHSILGCRFSIIAGCHNDTIVGVLICGGFG